MTIDRMAFRAVYNLIKGGCCSEKQAYDICLAIFWQPPTYLPPSEEDSAPQTGVQSSQNETVVKGFAGCESK